MDSLLSFLFKYRPLLFERGELTLAAPWPVWVVVGGGALLAVPALLSYVRRRGDAGPVDRAVLAGLRLLALSILVLCLLQPALVLSSAVPQRNFVAVLLDDSESMTVADDDGEPRSAFVADAFADPSSDLRAALAERFSLRFFRFGESAVRIEDPGTLTFRGRESRIGGALDAARSELEGVPLSGLVVVSDGAARGGEPLDQALLRARAAGVPVYAVGLGRERLARDVQVSRVEMASRVLAGSAVAVDVVLAHSGYAGRTVPLVVEEEGSEVARRAVALPEAGEPAVVRIHLTATTGGPRRFRFSVPPQEGERVPENNVRELLVEVEERTRKVLYVEGEPRFEVKFLRRAVADDDLLQVVVLQRTAENKFLRLDVDGPDELGGGFPRTREELFGYRALILGSVEASFFTPDQLRMIADFVSRRGGTLLALGGPSAFAEGGYAGTPVADALPVVVDGREPLGGRGFYAELQVRPTPAGEAHAALQLGDDAPGTLGFDSLPPLSVLNPIRRVKAGATTLLEGRGGGVDEPLVILAWQRYGRGRSLAFPVQDSWMWQMHADVPVDDATHETYWRQLLRWMVDGVPEGVAARYPPEAVDPGAPVELEAEVSDSAFLRMNDAEVVARITGPDGEASEVPLRWTADEDGRYRGEFVPGAQGLHRVEVEARRDGASLGVSRGWVRAAPSRQEFFDAGLNTGLLRRVAEETGGAFYTADGAGNLPEDLRHTGAGVTVTEERDLWDMPALFLLLVALLASEWGWRRLRGLA